MVSKGLPEQYKPFVVVVTQREKTHTFTEFKSSLRSFEDTEGARTVVGDSVIKTTAGSAHSQRFNASNVTCFKCRQTGHFSIRCKNSSKKKLWCSLCRKNSHSDVTCRFKNKSKQDSRDKFSHVADAVDESEHSFAFKANASFNDNCGVKLNSLLGDCGAMAHIVTDLSASVSVWYVTVRAIVPRGGWQVQRS